MTQKSRKLNFNIEESIWRELESLVPAGRRSKVVNEALRKELELIRRKNAVERLFSAPKKGKGFSSQEIVEALSKDRRSH